MEQIKEAYVSFEVAKLLKEKGFDERTNKYYQLNCYNEPLQFTGEFFRWNKTCNKFCRPTQQMAMDWLRLKHKLCVEPYRTACGYLYLISNIPYGTTLYSDRYNGDDEDSGQWTKWELACDAGIKYCLENLIK